MLPFLILMLDNPEWLIILAIVVILFGGSRLGQLGGSLGQGIREFKSAVQEGERTTTPSPPPPGGPSRVLPALGPNGAPSSPPTTPSLPAPVGDYRPE